MTCTSVCEGVHDLFLDRNDMYIYIYILIETIYIYMYILIETICISLHYYVLIMLNFMCLSSCQLV